MFRYKDALAKQMYLHTQGMCRLIAQRADAGSRDLLHYHMIARVFAGIFRIQWFGAWINGPMIHVKKERCVLCGTCVRNCPADNIRIKSGMIRFFNKCNMCMGCSMCCPTDAVRPGFLVLWRINGYYDFAALLADDKIPDEYINEKTKGYFRLFRKYYSRTNADLLHCNIFQD